MVALVVFNKRTEKKHINRRNNYINSVENWHFGGQYQ